MAFFWITGLSGSGKTTVLTELKALGFEAHDGDGLSQWHDIKTGAVVPDIPAAQRPSDWSERNEWRIDAARVRQIAKRAAGKDVFVGGAVANETEIWSLFDRHVFLTIGDAVMRSRIIGRTNNDYGKGPGELNALLLWNQTAESAYRGFGASIVDSSCPLSDVVNKVLAATVRARHVQAGYEGTTLA